MNRVLLLLVLLLPACCLGQVLAFNLPVNRMDKKGNRIGRWEYYFDEAKKQPDQMGRFKRGEQCGRWAYYSREGSLIKKEKYNLRKNTVKTRIYKNGKLHRKGTAIMTEESEGIHYYWEGKWKCYDEKGKFEKTLVYRKGKIVNTLLPGEK